MKIFKNRQANSLNKKRYVIDEESITRNFAGEITSFVAEEVRVDTPTEEGTPLEANELIEIIRDFVDAYHSTDQTKTNYDKQYLTLPSVLTPNYVLPSKGILNSDITWEVVSGTEVYIEEGLLKFEQYLVEREIELLATISSGSVEDSKHFTVSLDKLSIEEAIDIDYNNLTLPTKIVGDYQLPINCPKGSIISWALENDNNLGYAQLSGLNKLTVTRKENDYTINLIATLKLADEIRYKQLSVVVEKRSSILRTNFANQTWLQDKTKPKEETISISFNNTDILHVEVANDYKEYIDIITEDGTNPTVTIKEKEKLNDLTHPYTTVYYYKIKVYFKKDGYYIGEIPFNITYITSSTTPED